MNFASKWACCFFAMVLLAGCGSDDSAAGSSDPGGDVDVGKDADAAAGDVGTPEDAAADTAPAPDSSTPPDTSPTPDASPEPDTQPIEDTGADTGGQGLYLGTADPYGPGDLSVSVTEVDEGADGAPVAMQIYEPDADGTYAVVVFQHGFQMQNGYYSTLLEHLASHGFVVVAPQMTSGGAFNSPSAQEEADEAQQLYDWLEANLGEQVSVDPSLDHVGLSGHSRGAKVIWLVMSKDPDYADALAGVDPVDGTGGPLGGEERVIDGQFGFSLPVYVLGTGLGPEENFGQACAPDGDNHEQFYSASQSPAWHMVAADHGHLDMLDDETPNCGAACSLCPGGDDKQSMRTLTAGTLVAFFRGALQSENAAYDVLTDTAGAPTAITVDSK
jgi:chlorophyllase